MDKFKLREYLQSNTARLFMIGGIASDDLYPQKKIIKQAMQGRPIEFVYEGPTRRVKPYQAKLWVSAAPTVGSYVGFGYTNYLDPTSRNGLEAMDSFESACKAYEMEFGYYPENILLVRV
ncbi:hypothetical protein [Pontibacter sp. HSC-36F09]|uniref:hypothetical protein n=1 Tax=Pontibacter sp. HSC-36F09 TaxID=2910966 RepID=UPI00209D26A1|nr:hypothetical protein [Pontibacter sp. HSC-36F09]MCP2043492.1 hypothetical protein [Pontibacter sp. HSC-36F09]